MISVLAYLSTFIWFAAVALNACNACECVPHLTPLFRIRQNDVRSCHHRSQHSIFLLGTCLLPSLELRPCQALVRRSIVLCLTALKCMSISIHGSPRLDESWNSKNCTAHMSLHPISRHPMSSRVTRPSPWRIFRICSQLHHLFSGITFPSTWFLRVPWSRFLYLCHDNVPVSHFQASSTVTVIQELDTKCFRRPKTHREPRATAVVPWCLAKTLPQPHPTEVSLSSFR